LIGTLGAIYPDLAGHANVVSGRVTNALARIVDPGLLPTPNLERPAASSA